MKTNPKNNNLPKQNNQRFFFLLTKINLKHKQNHKQSPSH